MKIIGESKDGFILQATHEECANLIGHYSRYDETTRRTLVVGADIAVAAMFRRLYHLSANKQEVAKIAERLRSLSALLEDSDPVSIISSAEAYEATD